MEDGKVLFERYEMGRVLGVGNFGKVCLGRHVGTGESVAIKIISKENVREQHMVEQIKREICAMRMVKHPNIVEIKEVMASKTKIYIVMEYVKGGELFAKVEKGKLPEDLARRYFRQLIEAVEFCHDRGVCHRDLKLENLLVDETGENLKVVDFGLSALTHRNHLLYTLCGAPAYVAPQVLKREGYDGFKADVWSCGVILYTLLAGHLPFQEENMMKMYAKILSGKYDFTPGFPPEARKLVSEMLVVNPEKRITIQAIKRSRWFQKPILTRVTTRLAKKTDRKKDVVGSPIYDHHPSPPFFNAFELISSMASGIDLSGFFDGDYGKIKPAVFACRSSDPAAVMAEIERVGKKKRFKVRKAEEYRVEMVEAGKGRLCVTVEVFIASPEIAVVEFSMSTGDASEFVRFCEEVARPALRELIFVC